MAIPAPKSLEVYNKYRARLSSFAAPIDTFTLYAMRAEMRRELDHADVEGAGALWVLISEVEDRLGHTAEADRAARIAVEALPDHPMVLNSYASRLGMRGETRKALDLFEHALAHAAAMPEMLQVLLCNVAVARAKLGAVDAGLNALAEAARATNMRDTSSVLLLLWACVALGEEDDAVEMLARFVALVKDEPRGDRPALDVIDSAPADLAPLMQEGSLATAVAAVRKRWSEPIPEEYRIQARIELAPEAWERFARLAGL